MGSGDALGLPLAISRYWSWAAVEALPPLLPPAQEWCLCWLRAKLCFYKSSVLPCRIQTSPKGTRQLCGCLWQHCRAVKRQSKGQLSEMEYLVLLQLIQTNSSKTSPSSYPAGRTFTYPIHIPLSPQTLSQKHVLPKLISERLILKTTFINLISVDEAMRN